MTARAISAGLLWSALLACVPALAQAGDGDTVRLEGSVQSTPGEPGTGGTFAFDVTVQSLGGGFHVPEAVSNFVATQEVFCNPLDAPDTTETRNYTLAGPYAVTFDQTYGYTASESAFDTFPDQGFYIRQIEVGASSSSAILDATYRGPTTPPGGICGGFVDALVMEGPGLSTDLVSLSGTVLTRECEDFEVEGDCGLLDTVPYPDARVMTFKRNSDGSPGELLVASRTDSDGGYVHRVPEGSRTITRVEPEEGETFEPAKFEIVEPVRKDTALGLMTRCELPPEYAPPHRPGCDLVRVKGEVDDVVGAPYEDAFAGVVGDIDLTDEDGRFELYATRAKNDDKKTRFAFESQEGHATELEKVDRLTKNRSLKKPVVLAYTVNLDGVTETEDAASFTADAMPAIGDGEWVAELVEPKGDPDDNNVIGRTEFTVSGRDEPFTIEAFEDRRIPTERGFDVYLSCRGRFPGFSCRKRAKEPFEFRDVAARGGASAFALTSSRAHLVVASGLISP